MSDMGDDFREFRKQQQARHLQNWRDNLAVLRSSGIKFHLVNHDQTALIRETGRPRVDFYPSTGRWKVIDSGSMMKGGAQAFIRWYARQIIKSGEIAS